MYYFKLHLNYENEYTRLHLKDIVIFATIILEHRWALIVIIFILINGTIGLAFTNVKFLIHLNSNRVF